MKSKRTDQLLRRRGLSALIAGLTLVGGGQVAQAGDGHGKHLPQGPVFKTLDLVAGGIESVLQKTVLAGRRSSPTCDSSLCDDGCDATTLHELEIFSLDSPNLMPSPFPMSPAESYLPEATPWLPEPDVGDYRSEAPGYWDAPADQSPEASPIRPPVTRPAAPPVATPVTPPTGGSATPRPAAEPSIAPKETDPVSPFGLQKAPVEGAPTPLPPTPPRSGTPDEMAPAEEDEWIESFAPKQPTSRTTPRRFTPERKTPQRPSDTGRPSAPRIDRQDALDDPFRDDPQSRAIQSDGPLMNGPPKSTRASKPTRSTVKPAGFVRPR